VNTRRGKTSHINVDNVTTFATCGRTL